MRLRRGSSVRIRKDGSLEKVESGLRDLQTFGIAQNRQRNLWKSLEKKGSDLRKLAKTLGGFAPWRLALHLVGHDVEAREGGDAEGGGDCDIGRVTAARHQDAANARVVVAGVHRVPAPA